MEKTKYVFLLTIFSLIVLVSSINFITAAVINPADSTTISGAVAALNASNTSLPNMVNCTFYARSSALTANTSWASLGVAVNVSGNAVNVNTTFNSNILEDGPDYQFNATCRNLSNFQTSSVGTATVTINNGVPDAPSVLSPITNSIVTSTTAETFSSTVTDSKTTSCTYKMAQNLPLDASAAGYETGSATYSDSTCSFTKAFANSNNGEWYWVMTSSDGTDTTDSDQLILKVEITAAGGSSSGGGAVSAPSSTATSGAFSAAGTSPTGFNSKTLIIVVAILVGGYLLFFRKK